MAAHLENKACVKRKLLLREHVHDVAYRNMEFVQVHLYTDT